MIQEQSPYLIGTPVQQTHRTRRHRVLPGSNPPPRVGERPSSSNPAGPPFGRPVSDSPDARSRVSTQLDSLALGGELNSRPDSHASVSNSARPDVSGTGTQRRTTGCTTYSTLFAYGANKDSVASHRWRPVYVRMPGTWIRRLPLSLLGRFILVVLNVVAWDFLCERHGGSERWVYRWDGFATSNVHHHVL